jgi:hypothetical protein
LITEGWATQDAVADIQRELEGFAQLVSYVILNHQTEEGKRRIEFGQDQAADVHCREAEMQVRAYLYVVA